MFIEKSTPHPLPCEGYVAIESLSIVNERQKLYKLCPQRSKSYGFVKRLNSSLALWLISSLVLLVCPDGHRVSFPSSQRTLFPPLNMYRVGEIPLHGGPECAVTLG